jgi:hypothetical protein
VSGPRRDDPRGEGPAHPPLRALVLVAGVFAAIVVLALLSTFGRL